MKYARYIDDKGNVAVVNADKITPFDNEEKYKGNLYCEDKKCRARLYYAERQNPKLNRHFCTIPKSLHRDGCPNEINHDGTRKAIVFIRGEGSNVSDEHIMKTLKDAYKNYKNDLNPDKKGNPSNNTERKKKKKKVNPVTDESSGLTAVTKESPSTSGVDIQLNGEKEPNIHRNEVSRIIVKEEEPFKEIHGIIDSVTDIKGNINVYLKGTNGGKCRVFFGTPFESQHQQEYKLLSLIKEYIMQCLEEKRNVQFHCFAELKEEKRGVSAQVYSYKHLFVDGMTFYEMVRSVRGF